jgi:glucose-1-phosphate cytidylyltransferase
MNNVPVFILAGGLGTRIKEDTEFRPKPMVPIGEYPILWHIMKKYSRHGFKKFVICAGFKAEAIKDYFLSYYAIQQDFTVNLANNRTIFHNEKLALDWEVTVAYTGEAAMTGARVARAAGKYLGAAEVFAVTYGDAVTDADLALELEFHLAHGKMGTILGVNPPSRFGECRLDGDTVVQFSEKPDLTENWINGGFFIFRRDFLKYLSDGEDCVLERAPLVRLAKDGQMKLFKHRGFWACMDTQRDRDYLNQLWKSGQAPWAVEQR